MMSVIGYLCAIYLSNAADGSGLAAGQAPETK
jgi:hypothetical protein